MDQLSHELLQQRRQHHPAWRLLAADNAPLILGFLAESFLIPNVRSLSEPEVVEALEDYQDRQRAVTPGAYPKDAKAYLTDWTPLWLRRSFPAGSDVPQYEPTAAVETAASFCRELGPREFVGTASRLLTIRDLLRQIAVGAASDPDDRIAALLQQRSEIDAQIARIRAGDDTPMDGTAVRERYDQVTATARALLGDLRAVEAGLRELDRDVRRRATTWEGPRGAFLATVFDSADSIGQSDQGRSWRAFWEHLLSSSARAELEQLLARTASLPELEGRTGEVEVVLGAELFHAAQTTQRTVASLSAQLRRFLDDQSWAETRRINALIRRVLQASLAARDEDLTGMEALDLRADLNLPLERPLYTPRHAGALDAGVAPQGDVSEVDLKDLLELASLDLQRLHAAVSTSLGDRGGHATLGQVLGDNPLEEGLAELVAYLQVGTDRGAQSTTAREQVAWTGTDGRDREADIPLVVFSAELP